MILFDRYAVVVVREVVAWARVELSGVRQQDADGQHSNPHEATAIGYVVLGPLTLIAAQLLFRSS